MKINQKALHKFYFNTSDHAEKITNQCLIIFLCLSGPGHGMAENGTVQRVSVPRRVSSGTIRSR